MRNNLSFALSIAFISACGACSQLGAAPDQLIETPLLVDFRTFCVDTKAQPEVVRAAVERAGAAPTDSPSQSGLNKMWEHTTSGHIIWVSVGTLPWHGNGPDKSNICLVQDYDDNNASFMGLQKWLGTPHTDPMPTYELRLSSGHADVLSRSDVLMEQNARSSEEIFDLFTIRHLSSTSIGLQRRDAYIR